MLVISPPVRACTVYDFFAYIYTNVISQCTTFVLQDWWVDLYHLLYYSQELIEIYICLQAYYYALTSMWPILRWCHWWGDMLAIATLCWVWEMTQKRHISLIWALVLNVPGDDSIPTRKLRLQHCPNGQAVGNDKLAQDFGANEFSGTFNTYHVQHRTDVWTDWRMMYLSYTKCRKKKTQAFMSLRAILCFHYTTYVIVFFNLF